MLRKSKWVGVDVWLPVVTPRVSLTELWKAPHRNQCGMYTVWIMCGNFL